MDRELLPASSRPVLASYNIHGCIGPDKQYDRRRIATVLREINADILSVQELHAHGVGPETGDEVAFLTAVAGGEVVLGTTFTGGRGAYGIALFSRLPILAVRRIDLHVPPHEPRCALDVDLAVDCGTLRVITMHLGLRPWERRLQVQRLNESIEPNPQRLTVVLGDSNEWGFLARPLRLLETRFGPSSRVRTWPSWRPLFALDRLWVQPREALAAVWAHTSPTARRASDHLPLVGLLDIIPPGALHP
ncbi:MAG: endonuclease/exonuclease/phosphatase family protein [Candidatus Tectimicrobiota bacterium]